MKILILLAISVLFPIVVFCQGSNSDSNFQKGKKAFRAKEYQKALAYLSISISEYPNAQAYYYRSLTYDNLGDSCNSCRDLKMISSINIEEYRKLYNQKCSYFVITDNVPDPIKLKYNEVSKLKIVQYKCNSDTLLLGIIGEEPTTKEIEINLFEIKHINGDYKESSLVDEDQPVYPGGDYERMKFIQNNIRYPVLARDNGIQGTVYTTFMLNETGQISNVKIRRGIGGGCDEEAIRVIYLMPKWKPASQKGRPISVGFNMTIKFTLSK